MSRRSGQNGYIERKGSAYVVRFWMDVPGQERRVHKSIRICPISGPGKMSKPERERRSKEIIAESGADTAGHLRDCQAATLGTTFREQAEWWLRESARRKRRPVKARSVASWRSCLKWINGKIGGMPLASVNNVAMRELVQAMAEEGWSPATIRAYATVVKMVVASAVGEDGEPMYPRKWNHDFIDLPVVGEQRRPCFTGAQVSAIVKAGAQASATTGMLYALLAGSGLRVGEALALEVDHITTDGLTVSVRRTAWRGKVDAPKTACAVREVDLHPRLAALLRAYLGDRVAGFVFEGSRPEHPADVSHLTRGLWDVLAGVGVPKTGFHAFRRFRVTHLRKSRVPDDLIRFWVGHADRDVTDGYSRLREDESYRREVAGATDLGFTIPDLYPVVPKGQNERVVVTV